MHSFPDICASSAVKETQKYNGVSTLNRKIGTIHDKRSSMGRDAIPVARKCCVSAVQIASYCKVKTEAASTCHYCCIEKYGYETSSCRAIDSSRALFKDEPQFLNCLSSLSGSRLTQSSFLKSLSKRVIEISCKNRRDTHDSTAISLTSVHSFKKRYFIVFSVAVLSSCAVSKE